MPSHIAVLFCPKIANGHEAEASCFLFYAFDLFSNCSFLEISRLIAYSNRLFFKKYLSSITRVPCMSASHHDTSPLVYNIYVLKLWHRRTHSFQWKQTMDGFTRPGMQKSARVNFTIGFAFYVAGGRLTRFSLFVSLWWQGRNHNERENGHKVCFQMPRIWYRRKQERTRCCGFTAITNLMLWLLG